MQVEKGRTVDGPWAFDTFGINYNTGVLVLVHYIALLLAFQLQILQNLDRIVLA